MSSSVSRESRESRESQSGGGVDGALEARAIAQLRALCADVVQGARSGHPGAPLGLAPVAHVLFASAAASPAGALAVGAGTGDDDGAGWAARDRFVLSNGHACALLYSVLHLRGARGLPLDALRAFRQLHSPTPGHPERGGGALPDIALTTGPLGQGLAGAVGLAIAERHLAACFNRPGFPVVSSGTVVLCGDGCLQEGVAAEAASLAGHLGLGRLIVFWDDNGITIDGATDLAFTENVRARFEAYGWHTLEVARGDEDTDAIRAALAAARAETSRPTLVAVRTTIGYGSALAGTARVHGTPLGADGVAALKEAFGLDPARTYHVDEDVRALYAAATARAAARRTEWEALLARYAEAHPDLHAELVRRFAGHLPDGWLDALPRFGPDSPALATRAYGSAVLRALATRIPELVGGSADLNPSCLTYLTDSGDFQRGSPEGRNIRFGVREHAMAAVCNGLAAYGACIPFCSTFLNFAGYASGAMRLSALSGLGVLYIFTHDSVGVGEDGPTHQPIETLAALRATPNTLVLRPADGTETSACFALALERRMSPSVLVLSRQTCRNLAGSSVDGVRRGAYVLQQDAGGPAAHVVFVGTGSEVALCVDAAALLAADGVPARVVSMPCWEVFREQPEEYRCSVFPPDVPVLSVEAATAFGWREFADAHVAINRFGLSAPAPDVFKEFGFTPERVAAAARQLVQGSLARKRKRSADS